MPPSDSPLRLDAYSSVVFFIGAGMSAESGVPTYRGAGGIWSQYRYQDYACQRAFERDPQAVLAFHELRRQTVLACQPHEGHRRLAELQQRHPQLQVITQNIDGLLQRAGIRVAAELHGSLWRLRCTRHGLRDDALAGPFQRQRCEHCGAWLRPDITWFEDAVDERVFAQAAERVAGAQLFVSIGTSAVVYPAAGFIDLAQRSGAQMIEINPEPTEASARFRRRYAEPASTALRHFI